MLFGRQEKPIMNVQLDSIYAKLFTDLYFALSHLNFSANTALNTCHNLHL